MFRDFYIQRRFSKIKNPYPEKNDSTKNYLNSKRIEVEIKPNEMLFIPAGWFHFVISDKVDEISKLNVAVSFFTEYDGCIDCDLENQTFTETIRYSHEDKINYDSYKKKSFPCIINSSHIYNSGISIENLSNLYQNRDITVTKSHSDLFISNYIQEVYPECCVEVPMKFHEFLSLGMNDKKNNYYLLQSSVNLKSLKIDKPEFLKDEKGKNYCVWINFGKIFTGLHYDEHNNVLIQLQGTKKIILIPPSERNNLDLVNTTDPKILCEMKKKLSK
jgi:hypothetical protein